MLKKHNQIFLSSLVAADAVSTACAWAGATYAWLHAGTAKFLNPLIGLEYKGGFDIAIYWTALPVVVLITIFSISYHGLYRPRRSDRVINELFDLVKAVITAVIVLLAVSFFMKDITYSRGVVVLFLASAILMLVAERTAVRLLLMAARSKGLNLRHAVVVGTGETSRTFIERVKANPWAGIHVTGLVSVDKTVEKDILDCPILGSMDDLPTILANLPVDQLYIAVSSEEHAAVRKALDAISQEMIDVHIVPDLTEMETINTAISDFDGLPIISLRESPLFGWNEVIKRAFDIVFSLVILVALSPMLILLALLVKITSKGPVFYSQGRMGLNGQTFMMLKFRTMVEGAEKATGAVWATKDDPRKTAIGGFLRKTSLDELPQFLNVLVGHMSVVGPRPERPELIEDFKKKIPKYMLRHKVKAGITGWAQVSGWRGNTSLEKRIQYDMYYIENWSFWFDVKIILMTFFAFRKNAY